MNVEPLYEGLSAELRERGARLVADVVARHRQEGQVATGRTSATLRVEPTAEGIAIVGWKYAGTYDEGRAPGTMPPVQAIEAWIVAKGLTFDKPNQLHNYAYCIARKIAREGTRRYRTHADVWATPIEELREGMKSYASKYIATSVARLLMRSDINTGRE